MHWVSTTQKAGGCEGQVYCIRTLANDDYPVRAHIEWHDGLEDDLYHGDSTEDAMRAAEVHNNLCRKSRG